MSNFSVLLVMIAAGMFLAFQTPINATLARTVGLHESALISFSVGTVFAVVAVVAFGKGDLRAAVGLPWWQFAGGLLGVVFITTIMLAVQRIGLTAVMVAGLAGQLSTAIVVDRFGWFGVPQRDVEWQRVVGVALLFVAIWLIYDRR